MSTQENIFLIGFMGSGKSTVAAGFCRDHNKKLVEMDQLITERENMSIPEIFETKGENYFRSLESELVTEIQQKNEQVISCGGGVVLRSENVEAMKRNGRIVLLTASPETILERVRDDETRPLLKGRKTVQGILELMEQRREKYEAAADIIVQTDRKTVAEICAEILTKLEKAGDR